MSNLPRILMGVDLGKVTLSLAMAERDECGKLVNIRAIHKRHLGKPIDLFIKHYLELDHRRILGVAATGIYGDRLTSPVITGVPEEIAQEYAALRLYPASGSVNIIRIGGRGYSVLTRDDRGRVNYFENDKCSAGTGETIEKICARLGLSLERAIELADNASESIPITARCSVFAKTELTHFANQGEPHERLLKGYFESVARNIFSLYDKCKVPGPAVLIGNGALIGPVTEAFSKMAKTRVMVSAEAGAYEALGALFYAAERKWDEKLEWPQDPQALVKVKENRIQALKPASLSAGTVIRLEDNGADAMTDCPAVLGIDLGSTGSKAALIDAENFSVIADVYRRTDGNPVEAAKALVAELIQKMDRAVIAIGLTGSGRDAAATVFRAAYPELSSRILVQNEIVAHAAAAIRYDPDRGRSLSIVEIGGQDAKFINIKGGRIVESDMNRACSAGTGSFLEEQGVFYGVKDIARFGEIAGSGKKPPELGQMCTVFVADQAAQALNEGYTVEDIFAGFQYSVILNYKNRVMGNRQFMDRIFFQGKPAANPSLARTLAAVTGREVYVPPNPGAMGAIGIAMLAGEETGKINDLRTFDLKKITSAKTVSRQTIRCNDSKCQNLCRIETSTIEVLGRQHKVVSGGNCPKYEAVSSAERKLPKDAANPYRERRELFDRMLSNAGGQGRGPSLGIPLGHYLIDYAVFFHAFFSKLGAKAEVIRAGPETFPLGNRRCTANNTCMPVKLMHGLARTDLDYMFIPRFVEIPRLVKSSGAGTCPMTQAAAQMVEKALEAEAAKVKVLKPVFRLGQKGFQSPKFIAELLKTWNAISKDLGIAGRNPLTFAAAYRDALRKQQNFEQGLMEIGARSLEFSREQGYPVVLVAGNSHLIHEPIMNANINELIMKNGAIALPLDCFPIPDAIPPLQRVYWGTSSRILRASIAAASDGNIFPLMMESYGCGPSSFVEHLFNDLLENYPHTVLESDGHGGQAGYVTRIQAFLYSARSYKKGGSDAVPREKIERYDRFPVHSMDELRSSKIVEFPVGQYGGEHSAAIKRSRGIDADFAGPMDAAVFQAGREVCSGKECLPHQLILGSFCKYLKDHPRKEGGKVFLHDVAGCGPCRNGMFPLADEIALRKMGREAKVEVVTSGSFTGEPACAAGRWFSMVGIDLLRQMLLYYRPAEKEPGATDRMFKEYADKMTKLLEQPIRPGAYRIIFKNLSLFENLLAKAAKAFLTIPVKAGLEKDLRTVYMCGDIFLRADEWASDDLARRLNGLGLRVILEPYAEMGELLALYRSEELVEMESRWIRNRLMRLLMDFASARLVAPVKKEHPWIDWNDIRDIDAASKELIDRVPFVESISTIGAALHTWRTRPVDGIVAVGPWGCGPALISEAQLRRETEIPFLFIYNDGEPVEQSKLTGFAWRLKNRPARRTQ